MQNHQCLSKSLRVYGSQGVYIHTLFFELARNSLLIILSPNDFVYSPVLAFLRFPVRLSLGGGGCVEVETSAREALLKTQINKPPQGCHKPIRGLTSLNKPIQGSKKNRHTSLVHKVTYLPPLLAPPTEQFPTSPSASAVLCPNFANSCENSSDVAPAGSRLYRRLSIGRLPRTAPSDLQFGLSKKTTLLLHHVICSASLTEARGLPLMGNRRKDSSDSGKREKDLRFAKTARPTKWE
jgi:hypothetical protein